jgi:iron complex outermembrane receptor protein
LARLRQQNRTLGDTLEKRVGVHTNLHAKVASMPVISGLSGSRILITQNGLDVSDVSRLGLDHAVASEASTATQSKVLHGPATLFYGPATLFYGSGAVDGVVNVVDGRVPTSNETRGECNSASLTYTVKIHGVADREVNICLQASV